MHSGKSGGLAQSKQVLESTPQEMRYTCPHCGMSFKGSRMLGSHLRLHGKRRIHPCNICGKEFNHSSSLSRHRLIHKKGKGLSKDAALGANMAALRDSLKKSKRQQAMLPQHATTAIMQSVGGDKFYACPQCDMSFRTSTQLSKHQVTHVKELLDNYTPGKENLAQSSSDLKIRIKLYSNDKPSSYALCKKNRRRRGGRPGKRSRMRREEHREEEWLIATAAASAGSTSATPPASLDTSRSTGAWMAAPAGGARRRSTTSTATPSPDSPVPRARPTRVQPAIKPSCIHPASPATRRPTWTRSSAPRPPSNATRETTWTSPLLSSPTRSEARPGPD
uniref:C2H2-type domain-containing protein n=1 Tax=Tetraodon nigroviridis TaxID=99883 RepID=H3D785_TETNG